jgi:hypothetical protein
VTAEAPPKAMHARKTQVWSRGMQPIWLDR